MMGSAKYIGHVGALAVALGVGNVRRTATRMTVSISVAAVVVMATVAPAPTVSPAVRLSADSTALIMGGTSGPTPDDTYIEIVKNQFVAPTHPGQDIDYVAVTTPEELWPFTGFVRLIGFAFGDPRLWGPGGPGWPDEPWWKLSGLFDLTADQSVQAGVADLEAAMAAHGNDHLVIYGLSQGAGVANVEKRKLAEHYPAGTTGPDIDFVLSGDPNLPNGGLLARLPGLYIPILDFSFNGPAATDTQFDTVEINRQYDGFADFPLYPLNLIADLNAILGIAYLHSNPFDVSLPTDPTTSPAYQGTHGDTSYYFFETQDLPLFAPLRQLGVPESLIDVLEPFFRVMVELGYDRSIPPWEPTPARLIPPLNLKTVASDLVDAVGEGIKNAASLIGSPAPLSAPATAGNADQDLPSEQLNLAAQTPNSANRAADDRAVQVVGTVGPQPKTSPALTRDNIMTSQPTIDRDPAATGVRIPETTGAVESVIGDGRTIVRAVGGDSGSAVVATDSVRGPGATGATTRPAPEALARDSATNASTDINKVVTTVSDTIKATPSGRTDQDDDNEDGVGGGMQ